jgi:hypothetical protein
MIAVLFLVLSQCIKQEKGRGFVRAESANLNINRIEFTFLI